MPIRCAAADSERLGRIRHAPRAKTLGRALGLATHGCSIKAGYFQNGQALDPPQLCSTAVLILRRSEVAIIHEGSERPETSQFFFVSFLVSLVSFVVILFSYCCEEQKVEPTRAPENHQEFLRLRRIELNSVCLKHAVSPFGIVCFDRSKTSPKIYRVSFNKAAQDKAAPTPSTLQARPINLYNADPD